MIYKGDIPPPSSEWSFPYNKVTISNLVLSEIDTLSKYRYSGWRAMSHMSQVTHVSRMNDVPHERWGQTCLVPKSQTKWNKLYKNFMKMILEPANNTNTNPFLSGTSPISRISNISYLQYLISPISGISRSPISDT